MKKFPHLWGDFFLSIIEEALPKGKSMLFLKFILIFCFIQVAVAAEKKIAVAKILRGEVNVLTMGKTEKLNLEDWIEEGAIIKTAEKSFAKIIFIDKSQMNIGPNSEMKIEKFSEQDAGVIDLVKGKIRSQVTKDYLQIKDKEKSKLFIKTPNAVMGVRGTDFIISTNGKNTSTVLFEGEIVFNNLKERNLIASDRLESIVDRGVRVFPGEFSVVDHTSSRPTIPSILNVQQRETLEKNDTFDQRAPNNANVSEEAKKSVVPVGLNGQVVANDASVLNNEVKQFSGSEISAAKVSNVEVDGYVSGAGVKPANGSVLHIDSGVIIPPSSTSVLDKNTNSYSASSEVIIDASGNVKLKGKEITDDGMILTTVVNSQGQKEVVAVAPPAPVVQTSEAPSVSVGSTTNQPSHNDVTLNPNGLGSMSNTNSGGGVQTVNEASQQFGNGASRVRTINTH